MQRVFFAYWGRRGITSLAAEIASAAAPRVDLDWRLSLSRQNEDLHLFDAHEARIVAIDTFGSHGGAAKFWRLPGVEANAAAAIRDFGADWVVNLMPHVWSSALANAARAAGARYATIVHDAGRHPGDPTGLVNRLLLADAARADLAFALSATVAEALAHQRPELTNRVRALFLPAWGRAPCAPRRPPAPGVPPRLLFAGRIMAYKGLPLLVEALEILHRRGVAARLTVLGEGRLGPLAPRLAALDAQVNNRWVDEHEFDDALAVHDVLVLPYLEASQSGPAARALKAELPTIATPVGGLAEQVLHGRTGLVAKAATAEAFAAEVERFATDEALQARLVEGVSAEAKSRSADRFLDLTLAALDGGRAG